MRPKPIQPKRLVAVVTPVVRFPLSPEEEISMCHLRHYLGAFDRYIIGPQSLPKEYSDFSLQPFPARYFKDRFGYNRLLLTEEFYRAFSEYEYILIYQLDCLVLSSNLEAWCRKDWDYAGAPWFKNEKNAEEGFLAVGNGGFSVRRVSSALAVFHSKRPAGNPELRGTEAGRSKLISDHLDSASSVSRVLRGTKTFLHRLGYHNSARWLARSIADSKIHEDCFWAYHAGQLVDDFRIPTPLEALDFSFEVAPRYCFAANSGRLPFGCHAWAKHDRTFWEPFLLPPAGTTA